jgi:hypothetical protein
MNTVGRIEIVHALPGRVRLRARRLSGQRAALTQAAHALAAAGPFTRVTARPETGSLIIEDEGRALDAALLARVLDGLVGAARDAEGRPLSEPRPEDHPGPTRIARAVAHAVAGVNTDVRAALGDRADLGTILPVFFAAAGLVEAARTRKLPVPTWFNLLWWSLRSFMTFNIRAVEDEVENGAAADGEGRGITMF